MPNDQPSDAQTIPVVEERLVVGRTVRETGAVRVRIEVERRDEALTLETVAEQVVAERVPVNRVVDRRVEPWTEGDVTVVPVYAEVEVVERRLVLVEELRLVRRATRTTEAHVVPVERQRAVVERLQPDGRWLAEPADGAGAHGESTDATRPTP